MSIRTNATLVGEIIELDAAIDVTPFINAASILVDLIEEDSSSPAASVLTVIETWLAAHFYTVRDPRPASEAAGSVSVSYQSAVSFGFKTSHYGQMALILDTSGVLKSMNVDRIKRKLSVSWLGSDVSKQTADLND